MDNNDFLNQMIEKYKNPNNVTKNQHYVPQFYLKKFTNSEWRLETLDKENKRLLKSQSVDHVCSWMFFYWVETWKEDLTSQLLEEMFTAYENNFALIYQSLIDNINTYWEIDDSLIFQLCEFVTISRFRWKYFREQLKSMSQDAMKKMMQMWYSMLKNYNPEDEHIKDIVSNKNADDMIVNWKFNIVENNASYIKFITDEKNIHCYTNLFFNKKINIYLATWERNFITSDCCVIELLPEKHQFYGVNFLDRLHYFVLSPRILIEFLPPHYSKKKVSRKQIDDKMVMYFNFLRWMKWNYLYSCSKEDLNEKLYSKARFDFTDKLFSLFPTEFSKDKETKDLLIKISNIWWINIDTIYDMLMNQGKTIEEITNIIQRRFLKNKSFRYL